MHTIARIRYLLIFCLLNSCYLYGAAAPDVTPPITPPITPPSSARSSHSSSTELPCPIDSKSVFCIPICDAPFKYMMTDKDVRKSFIETFVPGAKVESIHLIGEALNPIQIETQAISSTAIDTALAQIKKLRDYRYNWMEKLWMQTFCIK